MGALSHFSDGDRSYAAQGMGPRLRPPMVRGIVPMPKVIASVGRCGIEGCAVWHIARSCVTLVNSHLESTQDSCSGLHQQWMHFLQKCREAGRETMEPVVRYSLGKTPDGLSAVRARQAAH